MPQSDLLEPLFIQGDEGRWLLADSEEQARQWIEEYEPDYRVIGAAGWMHEVGWNAYEYETKEDFDREAGYGSWWEGCQPPQDGQPTKKCRRAFELGFTDD